MPGVIKASTGKLRCGVPALGRAASGAGGSNEPELQRGVATDLTRFKRSV